VRPYIDLERYPAHLHVNLLPEARGRGVGHALLVRYRDALIARGAPGVHGESLASNSAVHRVLAGVGFHKEGAPYAVPGLRTPEGARVHGQLLLCDLNHDP
jgi:hypothetical protein